MENETLEKFGFKFRRRSVHTGRTIMLDELIKLLNSVPSANDTSDYIKAIIDENCLLKRSSSSREITAQFLIELYSLDPKIPIFRTFLFFWNRDEDGRPLLAMMCAFCRDWVLNHTFDEILAKDINCIVHKYEMEEWIDAVEPDRFSESTLQSMARNALASWSKSGHLKGSREKVRVRANPTPATVAYAIFLGYLRGVRGPALFETNFMALNDCNRNVAIELAEIASQRGWIVFNRVGNVIDISIPNLVKKEEVHLLDEQS